MKPGLAVMLAFLASFAAGCAQAEPRPSGDPGLYIKGGRILSMVEGEAPFVANILVRNGRIESITRSGRAPVGAKVIDAAGRYVMPGLIDMHAHVNFLSDTANDPEHAYDRATSEKVLKALLAYGVTTVRNPAAPTEEGVKLRDDVAAGLIPGPRIFTAGWSLNGRPYDTEEKVRREVKRQCALRVDYIKVYANSTPALTRAAIDQAHSCGIKVIGHLQATDWATASADGIDFVTHAVSWSPLVLPPDRRAEYISRIKAEGAMEARIWWLEAVDVDGPEMDRVVAELKRHGVSDDPTLVAYATKFLRSDVYRGEANVRLAPKALRDSWIEDDLTKDWTDQDYARMARAWPKMLAIVRRYHAEGVRLTTGSDLPNRFVVPGASLGQEMQLLHSAGISTAEVLAMATREAAAALGQACAFGVVAPGRRADLLILERDPLRDLANVASVSTVVTDGRVYAPKSLLRHMG